MKHHLGLIAAAFLLGLASGCASVTDTNSVSFSGPVVNVMKAPLAGDFSRCDHAEDLKTGTSSEVVYFQFYYPLASVGDESIKSAMRNGGITDLYYADYSLRYFLIIGWYTITAYGK